VAELKRSAEEMKVVELPAYFERKRINPSAYHLHGTGIGDEHCIEEGPRGWSVYYHERGAKNDEIVFQNEEEAVALLVSRIERDPLSFLDALKEPIQPPQTTRGKAPRG
jgi:hypothetical protein